MRKLAILTIIDYNNYGNRLQNYATQEILRSLGFSVETIVNHPTPPPARVKGKQARMINLIKKLSKMSLREVLSKIDSRLRNYIGRNKRKRRIAAFKQFSASYIAETKFSISNNHIPNDLSDQYDYFVTGSDQVWNPVFRYGSSIDFLTFAERKQRVAYAPSFGVAEIPIEYRDQYKAWLSEMSGLSVREKAGSHIIKELTGRDAIVLVDPTLMLTKKEWLSISKPASNKPQANYLLTYFLGKVTAMDKRMMNHIAKENGLQIVNLADMRDKETYVTGPSEFIDYIQGASVFCTDSYHGIIFSILMETPFIVFNRNSPYPSMNSRIDTLLDTFNLNARRAHHIHRNEQALEADYSQVGPILEAERIKGLDYLKEALV